MAGVDSLLRMLSQYSADELRLGTDEAPRMLQRGSPVRLSIPPTSDDVLRHLVASLLTAETEARLREQGKVELAYAPEGGGDRYTVTFERRDQPGVALAFGVTFRRGGSSVAPPGPRLVTAAAPPPPAPSEPRVPTDSPSPLLVSLLERGLAHG